jgi:hypothetical protein
VPVVHTHRLLIRVALGASIVFSALALAGCAKRTEVSVASVETPAPAPPQPKPKPPGNDGKGTGGFDPIGGLIGASPPAGSPAEQALLQKYKTALVGTWTADLGKGVTEERVYTATGTFTAKLIGATPASAAGKYTVQGLVGTKGLKIQLENGNAPRTITATFDDDELHHPTLQPGVTGTFRKK